MQNSNIKPFVGRLAKSVRDELGVLIKVQKLGTTLRHFEGKAPPPPRRKTARPAFTVVNIQL